MSANQIEESVVDALYDELFRRGKRLRDPVPMDPKAIIRKHLTAAQQQGQGGGQVPESVEFWAARLEMLADMHGCGSATMRESARLLRELASAPPSAPVGVEAAAREVIESINRFRDAGTRPGDGTLVHWEATLHRALAQQPAAVDAKDAEIETLKAEVSAQRTRADAMAGEAIKHEARAEWLAEALRLIESAKDRGFGIDYARGLAQSALLREARP